MRLPRRLRLESELGPFSNLPHPCKDDTYSKGKIFIVSLLCFLSFVRRCWQHCLEPQQPSNSMAPRRAISSLASRLCRTAPIRASTIPFRNNAFTGCGRRHFSVTRPFRLMDLSSFTEEQLSVRDAIQKICSISRMTTGRNMTRVGLTPKTSTLLLLQMVGWVLLYQRNLEVLG